MLLAKPIKNSVERFFCAKSKMDDILGMCTVLSKVLLVKFSLEILNYTVINLPKVLFHFSHEQIADIVSCPSSILIRLSFL